MMDTSRRTETPVKIPPNARFRTTLSGSTVAEIKAHIIQFWAQFRVGNPNDDTFIQLDIVDGRKPSGFSAAAKAGELGQDVYVTRKTRSAA
jgi:hypothetical protein